MVKSLSLKACPWDAKIISNSEGFGYFDNVSEENGHCACVGMYGTSDPGQDTLLGFCGKRNSKEIVCTCSGDKDIPDQLLKELNSIVYA